MIIKARQQKVHAKPNPACSAEATARHRGNHHGGFLAPTGVLRADRAPADQPGGDVFELFADLFTDAMLF